MNFTNFAELSKFYSQEQVGTFSLVSPLAFLIFRLTFLTFLLLSEFLFTFRIRIYFPNFGRKWTLNRDPRVPLFSNYELSIFDSSYIHISIYPYIHISIYPYIHMYPYIHISIYPHIHISID